MPILYRDISILYTVYYVLYIFIYIKIYLGRISRHMFWVLSSDYHKIWNMIHIVITLYYSAIGILYCPADPSNRSAVRISCGYRCSNSKHPSYFISVIPTKFLRIEDFDAKKCCLKFQLGTHYFFNLLSTFPSTGWIQTLFQLILKILNTGISTKSSDSLSKMSQKSKICKS